MIQNFVFSFAAAFFSVVVFFIGAALMSAAAGHGEIAKALKGSDEQKPLPALNQQRTGYTADYVKEVWERTKTVDPELKSEKVYLKMDLVFPLFYGSVLACCLALVQRATGANLHFAALYGPVVVTVLSDWIENTTQLTLIGTYTASEASLDPGMVQLASAATVLKLACFVLSVLLIAALPLFAQTPSE